MPIANNPSIYIGYSSIDYSDTEKRKIEAQSWELVEELQQNRRTEAIEEIKEMWN